MRTIPQLIGVLTLLALIVFGASKYDAQESHNDLRVWFFDVGQGDAILLDTPENQQILIDGGPDGSILRELNKALPFTDKDIDLVIVTHNHADHITGIVEVLRHYQVKEIWLTGAIHTTNIFRTMLEEINKRGVKAEVVAAGKTINFGNLGGIVLYPLEAKTGSTPEDQNALSLVTFWQYGGTTLLMTGDAGVEQESELLGRQLLRSTTILKVGHQGSHTSSSEAFLKLIQPKVGVISVGAKNQYGHPHQDVLDRYLSLGIPLLRTDQDGTIRFDITLEGYSYKTGL
ncbi:MAG: MBL fold metallo-hydrolase [Candidatus Berkelbacteria bacterium]|nr:MAG: MBL fold metallo-hydrolase [Candidatus Berkelbacteria bacterium]QQG51913.1 MAG: MBL fold metallo-hydrolase [Candidatus Berkelbacteria bacterium]